MPIIESAFKKIKTLTESLDPGLVVVTKKQTVQDIETLIHEGQYHFGENYLQAALPKIHALAHYPCQWHFIGQVQTNKLKLICEHFHWIQSICQQKQIVRIGQLSLSTPINICIQVSPMAVMCIQEYCHIHMFQEYCHIHMFQEYCHIHSLYIQEYQYIRHIHWQV